MSEKRAYDIEGIELSDDHYTVEQSLVRNKYVALDGDGNTVLRGKQKMFKMKEEFPFTDADGTDVFTVKAGGIIDVAGSYVLSDAVTGADLVILDNDFSIFRDTWTIRDAETETKLAEITDADGAHVGSIEGQFSLKDRYEIVIDDASTVPREPVVAAAMVIDAIQGN